MFETFTFDIVAYKKTLQRFICEWARQMELLGHKGYVNWNVLGFEYVTSAYE